MDDTQGPSRLLFRRRQTLAKPAPPPNLVQYGDVLIASLTYQLVFVGSVWGTRYLELRAGHLEQALGAALSSPECNGVFTEYFPPGTPITAAPRSGPITLDVPWQPVVYRDDLEVMATAMLHDGMLPSTGLDSFALVMVLPPGTILSSDPHAPPPGEDIGKGTNSMEGLGAYHGQFNLQANDGSPRRVYFAVTAWSDGSNGTAVPPGTHPAWQPWENACAGLYHELAELRLCRNIDEAPEAYVPPPVAGLGWIVWYKDAWQESGDLSVLSAGATPQLVFCKGTVGDLPGVPIQALWSNAAKAPFIPPRFQPQLP